MSKGPAATLFAAYRALLGDEGIDYEVADEGLLMVTGDAECGTCAGYLSVVDMHAGDEAAEVPVVLVQAAFVLPAAAFEPLPTEARPGAYELIAYLAPDLALGGFEIDPDDDRLRFRVSWVWPAGEVASALMMAPLIEALTSIDRFAPLFAAVLDDGVEPAHAYVEAALADLAEAGERPTEADRVRLLGILEVATTRYRARDDQASLDALAAHVRDLSAA